MYWELFRHGDGLVHVIGRHLDGGRDGKQPWHARVVYAECDEEIACINTNVKTMPVFLRANTRARYPTCIACWDRSNFGTYLPRHMRDG